MQSRPLEAGPALKSAGLRAPVGEDVTAAGDPVFQVAGQRGTRIRVQPQPAQLSDRVPGARFDARIAGNAQRTAQRRFENDLHQVALAAGRAHLDKIPQRTDVDVDTGLLTQLAHQRVAEALAGVDAPSRQQIRHMVATHVLGEQYVAVVHAQRGDANAEHSAGFAYVAARRLFAVCGRSQEVDL
jgi:hypothetical protein